MALRASNKLILRNSMKIYSICLVKNEADIIEETLSKALQWCDKIIVDDAGSSDDTWERVLKLAKTMPAVVAFQKKPRPFRDHLRADAFNAFRHEMSERDWWMKLDADEIYIDNPKRFLAGVPKRHHVVGTYHLQYKLTEHEAAIYESDRRKEWLSLPVEQRIKYYICDAGEPRAFRHRARLSWTGNASWPKHMGIMHPKRMRLKHMQYRSPQQIELRLRTRQEAVKQGYPVFAAYEGETSWKEKMACSSNLHFDDGSGRYFIDETEVPRLVERPFHRLVKFIMHGTGVWP
jgi:hypothetical protein